jgi:hypothetical protein
MRATAPERRALAGFIGWCALLFIAAGLLQVLAPYPFDADTGYHLAVARLIAHHGILRAFPWTPFSWLADHYADKELAFHLLLLPLSSMPFNTAARVAGTALGGLFLCLLYAVLRIERVRQPELWSLLALTCSGAFVLRFALVRPHLLSLVLALAITWAAARRRLPWVAGLSLLYPLSYVAWHLPLLLCGLVELAFLMARAKPAGRTVLAAALGVGVGVLLHPNFPNNVSLFWLQNVDILVSTAWGSKPGFELGTEFLPFVGAHWLRYVLWPALLVGFGLWAGFKRRREDALPLAFALVALTFLGLTLRTQRFVEYAAPFSALAAALAARSTGPRWLGSALVLVTTLHLAWWGSDPLRRLATRGEDLPPVVAERLRAAIPENAQVFTCDWGLTGELMWALPERKFLVALDPVFFWKKDPALYRLWYELVRHPPEDVAAVVRDRFGARFVLCDDREEWRDLVTAVDHSAGVTPLLKGQWYLAELSDPGAAAPTAPPR